MGEYIYPLATLVLDFFCIVLCIKLAVTHRSSVWLVPTFLSLTLLLGSLICLLATASQNAGQTISEMASYVSLFLFLISAIWILVLVSFSRRLSPKLKPEAYDEAEFLTEHSDVILEPRVDGRPTSAHKVEKPKPYVAEPGIEPYDVGTVQLLRPRRTVFPTQYDCP